MAEPTPPSSPVCFVSEDPSGAVIVDEPDLAALIDFHAGVALGNLIKEEAAAMVSDDPDHLVDLIGSLLLQEELVFFRNGESLSGHARVALGEVWKKPKRSATAK